MAGKLIWHQDGLLSLVEKTFGLSPRFFLPFFSHLFLRDKFLNLNWRLK
jgi:hypothetical protein